MAIFEGWSLFSDVDGTILVDEHATCKKNLVALDYFTQNGGRFAVATGRGLQGVERLIYRPFINMPCVLSNGSILYDFDSEEILYQQLLPEKAKEMARMIIQTRPELRLYVWDQRNRIEIGANNQYVPVHSTFSGLDSSPNEWTKLVAHVEPQESRTFMEWLRQLGEGEVEICTSSPNFIEVLPKAVSKGQTVARAINLLNLDVNRIAVIGDYLNDYEMLTLPGVHSFCPSNAMDEIKAVAGEILCSAEDGAVSELIYRIPSLVPVG